ncbi:MFS transporter [Brachybacterium hainanense]|uniref:MFS transporter n=1 Tax=Brachybacterium hainanense TaxID=1541174 RepID=A0ABV6R8I2_9MICO
MPPAPPAAASPWTPAFRRFFVAQCLSWLGSSMTPVALSFGVLRETGSTAALGLVLTASTVPMIALLLVGGVVADRVPRRALLTITHLVAGLAQLGSACWFLLDARSLPVLVAVTALGGLASAFTAPALRGIITDLVPHEAIGRANAVRTTSRNVTRMLGPGAAGLLVAVADAGWALALDAICLGLAAAVLATIPNPDSSPRPPGAPTPAPTAARTSLPGAVRELLADLRGGWEEFTKHRWLWLVTCAFTGMNVLIGGVWLVLGPVSAEHTIGSAGWGLVLGARAAGQVAGGVLAYRWSPARPMVAVLLLPLPYAAVFAALAAGGGLPLLLGLAVLAGLGSAMGDVLWETTLQQRVARDALSRVASIDMLLSFVSVPVGQLAAPALSALLGAPLVIGLGAVLCAGTLLAPLASADVRGLRAQAPR